MPDRLPRLGESYVPSGAPGKLPRLEELSVDQQEGLAGQVQPYEYSDFSFQPKLGQDNNRLRAQNQSTGRQVGLFLGNLIPNIAGTIIENVGYLGSMLTEWGDNRNYSNWLTEVGQDIKNPFGQIYRVNPEQTWDVSDPAWWFTNAESLIESATAFAGVGFGVAKGFGALTKFLRFGNESKTLLGASRKLSQLGTASTLAYTEAAQFGATTYETAYAQQYEKLRNEGLDPAAAEEQAKHLASQAAAAAVQLNTIFATALNLTAIAPLFKSNDELLTGLSKSFKRQSGETFDGWKQRLRATTAMDSDIAKLIDTRKNFMYSYLAESAQEGSEELINQWAETVGLERGKEGKELNGLADLLSETSSFFDATMNSQGALSFVLGAFGGLSQTVLIDRLPFHKVYTTADGQQSLRQMDAELTEDGKYKTKLLTSRAREKVGNKALFENAKQAIVNDFKRLEEINKEMEAAIKAGDTIEVERLKGQLFDSAAINSITLGLGNSFASQYEEIGALDNKKSLHEDLLPQVEELSAAIAAEQDPEAKDELKLQLQELNKQVLALTGVTEAMQRGFAKSPEDNKYRERAQQAVADVKEYEQLWEDIQAETSGGDQFHSRYGEYLFSKEVDVRRKRKILDNYNKQIQENEQKRDSLLSPDENTLDIHTISDLQVDASTARGLLEDVDVLKEALAGNDLVTLTDLAEKYLPNADSTEDLSSTIPGIISQLNQRIQSVEARFIQNTQSIEGTEGYLKWKEKNPTKSVIDYINIVAKKNAFSEDINADKAYWALQNEALNINKQNLDKLKSKKGKSDYIKQARTNHNKIAQTIKAKIDQDNKNYIDNLFDDRSASSLTTVQRDQYQQILIKQLQTLKQELTQLQQEVNTLEAKRASITSEGLKNRLNRHDDLIANFEAIIERKQRIKEIKKEIKAIERKLDVLMGNPAATTQEVEELEEDDIDPDELESEEEQDTNNQELLTTIKRYASNEMQVVGIIDVLNDYEKELRAGTAVFTLNFLDREGFVGKGKLSQGAAAAIMQEFQKQLEGIVEQEQKQPEEIDPIQAQIAEINKKRAEDLATLKKGSKGVVAKRKAINDAADLAISQLLMPDSEGVTEGVEIKTEDIPVEDETFVEPVQPLNDYEQGVYHEGAKVEQAASKINTLTHEYEQDIEQSSGDIVYVMKDTFSLNDAVNPLYLTHGGIKEGDKVQLVVDTEYDGPVNDRSFIYGQPKQKAISFSDFTDASGESIDINLVAELPIKIVASNGTTLGYLPTSSWITQKYSPTAVDFRNVVDEKYNSKGELVYSDNVETQRAANLLLRQKLALAFNNGKKEGLEGRVQSRSAGTVLRVAPQPTNNLLPDKSLQLAIAHNGIVKTEKNIPVEAEVNKNLKNIPGVLLPAPNGELIFEPLRTNLLGKAEIDTVVRAIEAYLTVDGDVQVSTEVREKAKRDLEKIQEHTGFNVFTAEGLTAFINQYYYYTTNFSDAQTKADQKVLKGQQKVPKFMLSISKSPGEGYKKSYIKAGVSFLNKLAKAQIDADGNLNEEFKDLLHDSDIGLASRFRVTVFSKPEFGLRGINSLGPIKELIWQPKTKNFKVATHESYNDLVRANSTTTAYGKLQLPSGEYVYFAHPNTQLNYNEIMDQQITAASKKKPSVAEFSKPVVTKEATTEQFTEAQKEAMRNLTTSMDDNFGLQRVRVVVQQAGEVPGKAVTLENLQELHTFTPVENRNGKTPIEVLEEMTRLGLDTIPKDQNPFYSCK